MKINTQHGITFLTAYMQTLQTEFAELEKKSEDVDVKGWFYRFFFTYKDGLSEDDFWTSMFIKNDIAQCKNQLNKFTYHLNCGDALCELHTDLHKRFYKFCVENKIPK